MKNILLAIVTMLTMSITMSAQDNNRPSRQGFDPAKMVEQRTEMMVKKYGLNEKQAAALKALNEKSLPQARGNGNRQRSEKADTAKTLRPRVERGQRGMGNRQGEATGRQGGARGGAQFEEYNKELQKIMTPEQYKAYQNDMENMRKGGPRGGFNGQRGGARGQRGAQQ